MIITKTINITCEAGKEAECSDLIRMRLENALTVKLMANTPRDTVNGHISIGHAPNNHYVTVVIYERDNEHEAERGSKTSSSRCKRPINLPTRRDLESLI